MNKFVIGCYFNSLPDWQRKQMIWPADFSLLKELYNSIKNDWQLVIIHDCLANADKPDDINYHEITPIHDQPGWARWLNNYLYLKNNPQIDWAFFVDSTDVEMIKDPFQFMCEDKLYIGSEPKKVNDSWMQAFHNDVSTKDFLESFKDETLLNCGILGGHRDLLLSFMAKLIDHYLQNVELNKIDCSVNIASDMGLFNKVAYESFADVIEYGPHINTTFGKWEPRETATAWWKHK